jgi:hypothetical protein
MSVEDDLAALRRTVVADPSVAHALADDRRLRAQLSQLVTSASADGSDLEPTALLATWLSCALGSPPSCGQPRGSGSRATLSSLLAARLGRGRRPEDGVRILSLDGGGTRCGACPEKAPDEPRSHGVAARCAPHRPSFARAAPAARS